MARPDTVLKFDPKMYRHFAIVTVALTGAVALFADGDKRAAVSDTVVDAQKYVQEVDLEPTLVMRNANVGSGDAAGLNGFYSDVGQNIYGTGFATTSTHAARRFSKLANAVTEEELGKLGLTKEQFMALSDEEKAKIMAKLNNGQSPLVEESVVKTSSSASLRRSGRNGPSADY